MLCGPLSKSVLNGTLFSSHRKNDNKSPTHQSIFPTKQLLPLLRLNDLAHTDFPCTALALRDLGSQRPPHYLMPVAHPNNLHPTLREHLLHKLNQPYNPRVIIEGIEPCSPGAISQSATSHPIPSHPTSFLLPITPRQAKKTNKENSTYDSR